MDAKSRIDEIKETLTGYIGRRVHVTVKKGKKLVLARRGVLEHVYPNIFVVLLDQRTAEDSERRMSFSYADILTRSVELVVFKESSTNNKSKKSTSK